MEHVQQRTAAKLEQRESTSRNKPHAKRRYKKAKAAPKKLTIEQGKFEMAFD
jgi:chaperone required for assembly of F1-ATPase